MKKNTSCRKPIRLTLLGLVLLPLVAVAQDFNEIEITTTPVRDGIYMLQGEQILNSAAGGFPVSYSVDGVQYIAIAAGEGVNYRRHTPEIRQRGGGNTLYVFRLP